MSEQTDAGTGQQSEGGYDPHASSLRGTADPAVLEELYAIRGSIDNVDATLVYLLAERFKCTQRVGRLKAEHELPPSDPGREAAQIERLRRLAADADLRHLVMHCKGLAAQREATQSVCRHIAAEDLGDLLVAGIYPEMCADETRPTGAKTRTT